MAVSDVKIWTGSEWESLKGPRGPNAHVTGTEPVAEGTGELWIDPTSNPTPQMPGPQIIYSTNEPTATVQGTLWINPS
jgi:hypothetical protein